MSISAIWYHNPVVLVDEDELGHIIPSATDSNADQMNAIMRFALYFTVILLVMRRDPNVLFMLVAVGAFTFIIHESKLREDQHRDDTMEKLEVEQGPDGELCSKPTRDNPFMNVLPTDVGDFPNRPKACSPGRSGVKKRIEKKFSHNLYRDVSDAFGRASHSRQFYTMPSSTVPNNREDFMKWCYERGPTCKEGNGVQCVRNNHEILST